MTGRTDNKLFTERLIQAQPELAGFVAALMPFAPDDVGDVVQETNRALIEHAAGYNADRPFRPWMLTFAKTQVKKFYNRRGRSRLVFDDELIARCENVFAVHDSDAYDQQPLLRRLSFCLRRLSPRQSQLVAMRYGANLPIKKIAKQLGVSDPSIRVALFAIRRKLGACMERVCDADEEETVPFDAFDEWVSRILEREPLNEIQQARWLDALRHSDEALERYLLQTRVGLLLVRYHQAVGEWSPEQTKKNLEKRIANRLFRPSFPPDRVRAAWKIAALFVVLVSGAFIGLRVSGIRSAHHGASAFSGAFAASVTRGEDDAKTGCAYVKTARASRMDGTLILIDGCDETPSFSNGSDVLVSGPSVRITDRGLDDSKTLVPSETTDAKEQEKKKMKTKNRLFASSAKLAKAITAGVLAITSYSAVADPVAVTLPYSNDFTEAVSEFTATPPERWILATETATYTNDVTGTAILSCASVYAPTLNGSDVAHGRAFTLAAKVSVWMANINGAYVSIVAQGSNSVFETTSGYRLQHRVKYKIGNAFTLYRNGVAVTNIDTACSLGNQYYQKWILQLQGVYVDSNADGHKDALDLTATFFDLRSSGSSYTMTYRDTAPLTGAFFGLLDNAGGGTLTADQNPFILWRSFSLTDDSPPPGGTVVFLF